MKTVSAENRRFCQPGDSDNIKIDKEFANLIPPLSASELAELHQSLDAEGCRDALVVWKGQDILVDGHNRIKHCREKGYLFTVTDKEFNDRDEVITFIITTQLGRRNLSPAAESYLRGKRYLETKKQGARTDKTSGQNDHKTTAEKLAEDFKVGEKTIRRDATFSEAVDQIVENTDTDAKNLILSRETGLTRGGVLRLSKLSPAEQKKFIEELKTSGKRPRRQRKSRKRTSITIPAQPKQLVTALLKQLKPDEIAEVSRALAAAVEKQKSQSSKEESTSKTQRRKTKSR